MAKKKKSAHYSGIGGQAVLEGVMMKNKDDYAVAIRKADGEIDVEVDVFRGLFPESRITKIPFLRGIFNFIDSLRLGMKCINHSAQFYEDGEAEETKLDKALDKISGGRGEKDSDGIYHSAFDRAGCGNFYSSAVLSVHAAEWIYPERFPACDY